MTEKMGSNPRELDFVRVGREFELAGFYCINLSIFSFLRLHGSF